MMKLLSLLPLFVLLPSTLLACGGEEGQPSLVDSDDSDLSGDGDNDVDGDSGEGGSWGVGSGGASGGGSEAGGSDPGGSSGEGFTPWGMCEVGEAPGVPLLNSGFVGRGACFEKSLGEVIAEVHENLPELAGVTTLFEDSDDGFFQNDALIYAFEKANGGFQLAFFQGSGDCPSGCIDSNWTYIDTNENCEPQRVGSFSSVYADEGNCFDVSGTPMWSKPQARPSTNACDVEGIVANFGGTFEVPFVGTREPCSDKGGDSAEEPVNGLITLTIEQDASDPSLGNITFSGDDIDPEWFGEEAYQVQFDYFQASVNVQWSNLPAMCAESLDVDAYLDFEGCSASKVSMFEARDTVCGADYCKGGLNIELDLSGVQLSVLD